MDEIQVSGIDRAAVAVDDIRILAQQDRRDHGQRRIAEQELVQAGETALGKADVIDNLSNGIDLRVFENLRQRQVVGGHHILGRALQDQGIREMLPENGRFLLVSVVDDDVQVQLFLVTGIILLPRIQAETFIAIDGNGRYLHRRCERTDRPNTDTLESL